MVGIVKMSLNNWSVKALKVYLYSITALTLINCNENIKREKVDDKLKYNIDENFLQEIDTTNFQFIYENGKISNFYRKYYMGIFAGSTKSCLYCIVNTENNLLTPLPVWSCNVNFNHLSNIVIVSKDSTQLKYKWDETKLKFILIN